MSVFWIIHLVKLTPVVMVAVHANNESINVELVGQQLLDFFAKIALA